MKKELQLISKTLNGVDLAVVVGELTSIERRDGLITPRAVVEEAKPETSPLHSFFEWDNGKAADGYRLWQARMLVQQVLVRDVGQGDEGPVVRAFVNITATGDTEEETENTGPTRGYVSMQTVLKSKSMQQQMIDYAYGQLKLWNTKFGNIQLFFGVSKEIEKLKLPKK